MVINLIVICLMIIFTAFFVAAEFAFVKIRKTQLEQLINDGNKTAKLSLHIVSHLDEYLSACQLGITLTSLAIGWIGESTIESLLHPVFNSLPFTASFNTISSLILSFGIMTFVHVVIGELIPKSISISKTERVVLFVTKPLHYFRQISFPFIWLLNYSASLIGKLIGVEISGEGNESHSEEELLLIANQSLTQGEINSEEFELISNSFRFDQTLAREIMVSRTDMDVLYDDLTVKAALDISLKQGHSRYPVAHKTKDDILGYITQKDLIKCYLENPEHAISSQIIPVLKNFENVPIKQLLNAMKKEKKHLAILVDEYGGTSGIVTIEDIIEEVFGDIQDEQDHEVPLIKQVNPLTYIADGRIDLYEIAKRFDLSFEELNREGGKKTASLGGWLLVYNQELTKVGSIVSYQNLTFEVTKMDQGVIVTEVKITINDQKHNDPSMS